MSFRIERINEFLHEEVSKILLKELEFDNCIVTVTNVQTTPNLLKSDILITVMPDTKEKEVLLNIKKNIYEIQQIINKKFRAKKVPKICFKIDEGTKNLYKIDKCSK